MTAITIGGIISGLDTTSIINKLVAVEGNSQTLLTQQQTAQKSAVTAYSSLLTSIGALATQVTALGDTSSWATTTASASAGSVTAKATGNSAASLTFTVGTVAAAHTLISSETVPSTAASVASSGSLTLQRSDGTSQVINVGGGTLAEVVAGINGASAGISASAVQTSPGNYRLQVASSTSGASSAFTLDGIDGFTSMDVLSQASDAQITVGDPNGTHYDIGSTTNTFNNVVQGLSFTVSQPESSPVTVSSTVDASGEATQISSIVTNINNLLSSIATNTTYDSTSKTGGPLLGDSTVRSLQQSLLSAVSAGNTPGLSVTQDGQLAFDASAFTTAFKANPAAVTSAYGSGSTFTADPGITSSTATVVNSVTGTTGGSYPIVLSANAKAEQWQAVPPGTGIVGRTLTLSRGTQIINYAVQGSDDATASANKLNTQLAEAGFGVSVSASGGNFVFTANNPGTSSAFSVSIDGGGTAAQTQAGQNVAGTIGGQAATGIGNVLSVAAGASSGAAGLSVAVNATDADLNANNGAIGSITYSPGLAQRLGSLFSQMSDSQTGQLVTAQESATKTIKDLQTQIDSWSARLEAYRANLTQKFTTMETALDALKVQSTALSQYFNTSTSSSAGTSSSSSSSSSS